MESISLQHRLSFYQLDNKKVEILKNINNSLTNELPDILDSFYNFLKGHPLSKNFFKTDIIEHLKSRQIQHWNRLFTCNFSDEFINESVKIGKIHYEQGITPFIYVGGYNLILNKLTLLITNKKISNSYPVNDLINAIHSILLMDMELALSSYTEYSVSSKAEDAIDHFADEILDKVINISKAVNQVALENSTMTVKLKGVDDHIHMISQITQQMSMGIKRISQNSKEVADKSLIAKEAATSGIPMVKKAADEMSQVEYIVKSSSDRVLAISEVSTQISEMIHSIEQISARIKVLAFNAAIEASRAGQAGKGFAVVAREVNKLSQETSKTTDQIAKTIRTLKEELNSIVTSMNQSVEAVSRGQSIMQDTSSKMKEISDNVEQSAHQINEVADTLSRQIQSVDNVNHGIHAVADSTTHNVDSIKKIISFNDRVEDMVKRQIEILYERNIPNKVIRVAKSDHFVWMKQLADVLSGIQRINEQELKDFKSCRLGKWYYNEGMSYLKNNELFKKLENPHKQVHDYGIKAVQLYKEGRENEALQVLSKVSQASEEVIQILDTLAKSLEKQ